MLTLTCRHIACYFIWTNYWHFSLSQGVIQGDFPRASACILRCKDMLVRVPKMVSEISAFNLEEFENMSRFRKNYCYFMQPFRDYIEISST